MAIQLLRISPIIYPPVSVAAVNFPSRSHAPVSAYFEWLCFCLGLKLETTEGNEPVTAGQESKDGGKRVEQRFRAKDPRFRVAKVRFGVWSVRRSRRLAQRGTVCSVGKESLDRASQFRMEPRANDALIDPSERVKTKCDGLLKSRGLSLGFKSLFKWH